ncbi:hypothetical protein LR48_Vigan07g147500 [Vigna angularis]|uniref:Uncharacterized protein n=2 Tax=Phaseolus angularis TaxID=3914 RepID=A0A0L9UYJ7_PHAAN|nr:hypothetical protein LR48_Vigan07g147500 [Vigna angularis]BAT81826.1 hypothetical protein VIGAN_03171600 [Vigna angularis var. angularis]
MKSLLQLEMNVLQENFLPRPRQQNETKEFSISRVTACNPSINHRAPLQSVSAPPKEITLLHRFSPSKPRQLLSGSTHPRTTFFLK